MSSIGFPDGQRITQWLGAPLVQATGFALGAGVHDDGPFNLASWASVVIAVKPTGGPITVKVKQALNSGPASLIAEVDIPVAAGAVLFEAVVLLADAVTVELVGTVIGTTVDYALYPSNTTTNSQVSGGTTATIPRVSALPATPSDGDAVSYQPDAAAFPGVEWLCIYNATTGYWDVLGGSPIDLESTTNLVTNTATWAQLGGDQAVIPNDGDYDLDFTCMIQTQTNGNQAFYLPLKKATLTPIAKSGTPLFEALTTYTVAGQSQIRGGGKTLDYTFVKGDIVVHGYDTVPNAANQFSFPRCKIMPRRIK